jgi:hypothetical protein
MYLIRRYGDELEVEKQTIETFDRTLSEADSRLRNRQNDAYIVYLNR